MRRENDSDFEEIFEDMKKINYKGRCEKRKVSKCEDICRTYSGIQSAMRWLHYPDCVQEIHIR